MELHDLDIFFTEERKKPVSSFMREADTVISVDFTVEEALDDLRGRSIRHQVQYIYAVDKDGKLKGVVSTRDLLFAEEKKKIKELINHHLVTVYDNDSLEDVLNKVIKHHLLAIPVVNAKGKLVGIFELLRSGEKELSLHTSIVASDIFQLIGISIEQSKLRSAVSACFYRLPWLLCNIVGGLLCAVIAYQFQNVLQEFIILSFFIPLVLTLSEAVSMQSTTLILQVLHTKKFAKKRIKQRMVTEWKSALLIGLGCALIVGILAIFWTPNPIVVLVIGLSIFFSMLIGVTFGSLLPLALNLLKLDPKVASGPIVLTLTDIFATATYLGIASWLLFTYVLY